MEQMSIGEFARRSRLFAKALRLYDELGLLPPARVDQDSGYRSYEPGQLKQARLIATALRQLQVPLTQIKAILPLEPARAATEIPQNGAEVFSLLRDSDLAADEYVTRFFATGAEHERNRNDNH